MRIKPVRITLLCGQCGARNYPNRPYPNRKADDGVDNDIALFTIKKYCSTCNQHTSHVESK